MKPKRRRLLLLPFLAPLFLLGWVISIIGDKKENLKRPVKVKRELVEEVSVRV